VYGGGSIGLMGAVADAALAERGRVTGIIPRFMQELEWAHGGLTELRVVEDMHERKRLLIENVDAVVALPGGCGTLEELLEVITLKRLAIYLKPIVLVNVCGYFDPLIQLFENAISERFMDARHRTMWSVVDSADDVLSAIETAPDWSAEARSFAAQ
ncbi:MAG: TIGR00730 family Rossman fold protein, partial [bacterium]|nr:TIGR00730 family Rossman fold protein [bacterium]